MLFAMAMLVVASAYLTLGASFWPYMIPLSYGTTGSRTDPISWSFFWGRVSSFPAVLICTGVVYRVSRQGPLVR